MSCRVIKNAEKHHVITIRGDYGNQVVTLVGPPTRQYLTAHPGPGQTFVSISGKKTLRKLAIAILRSQGTNVKE